MKAIITVDVPEHQIGQEVSVYFKDTMCIKGTCESETEVYAKHDEEVIKETVESVWGKPCADAVNRQAINNLQRYRYNCGETSVVCVSLASINELPSVYPQNDALDKIRAEISDLDRYFDNDYFVGNKDAMFKCDEVLQIIDKYGKGNKE